MIGRGTTSVPRAAQARLDGPAPRHLPGRGAWTFPWSRAAPSRRRLQGAIAPTPQGGGREAFSGPLSRPSVEASEGRLGGCTRERFDAPRSPGKEDGARCLRPFAETLWGTNPIRQGPASSREASLSRSSGGRSTVKGSSTLAVARVRKGSGGVSRTPSGGATRRPRRAVAKREWFEHRPTWGAIIGSRELQAAPWLTRGPGGAIRRGRVVVREVAPSCGCKRGGCDSLFANGASWRPEMRPRNGAMVPETLSFVARVGELVNGTALLGGQVGRYSKSSAGGKLVASSPSWRTYS